MDVGELRNGLADQPQRPAWLVPAAAVAGLLILVVIAWIVAGSVFAAKPADPRTGMTGAQLTAWEATAAPTGAPLLWRVKGASSTVYLFGSLHVLRSKMNWMDQRLFHAFDSSDEAWFELAEIDKDAPEYHWKSSYFASRAVLTEGLTEAEKTQLSTILHRYNYTLEEVAKLKPGVMAAMLSELDMMAGGFNFDRGADSTLFRRAGGLKKPVKGLATYREHYSYDVYLDVAAARGDGTAELKDALAAHFGTGPADDIHVMAKHWLNGDQGALTAMVARDRIRDPALNQKLLDERNAAWMPKIEAMIAGDQTVFVTVGAAHLVGPEGLVAQLRAKGYTVERVD